MTSRIEELVAREQATMGRECVLVDSWECEGATVVIYRLHARWDNYGAFHQTQVRFLVATPDAGQTTLTGGLVRIDTTRDS